MEKAKKVRFSRSFLFPWLMLPLQLLFDVFLTPFLKEHDVTELISTLILFIDETLLYWIPFLIAFGYALKHCTKFSNSLIPFAEVALGAILGILYGLASFCDKSLGFLEVFKFAGQGAILGIISIALYDMIHGAVKQRRLLKSKGVLNEEVKN